MFGLLEVKGDTVLECVHECQRREDMYDYVTKIHEVTEMNKTYGFTPDGKKGMYTGMHYRKYFRAFMRLKRRGSSE